MDKIIKVSSTLKSIFTILALFPIPVALFMWAYVDFQSKTIFGVPIVGGPIGFAVLPYWSAPPVLEGVTSGMRFVGFIVCLPITLLQTYLMWQLRQLFSYFSLGQVFTRGSTNSLRRAALVFLSIPIIAIPINTIVGVVLTYYNPIGHRILGVSFGTPQAFDVLTGLVLVVIAWIINEGQKLQEDAELTV